MTHSIIYFDHHATTPMYPEVLSYMLPFYGSNFGNPHSADHIVGWKAADAVEKGIAEVAQAVGVKKRDVIITSGATESNNLALKGMAFGLREKSPERNKIIISEIEHSCIMETVKWLKEQGFKVKIIGVKPNGIIDCDSLKDAIDDKTALVSVMLVNNEIGTIQPIREIADMAGKYGAMVHCDAAQAMGKIKLNFGELGIDLMSLSGHKCGGPMGIGALIVNQRASKNIQPMIHGGGQQRGLRSGTLPLPLVAGFGRACLLSDQNQPSYYAHTQKLQEQLIKGLLEIFPHIKINGDRVQRVPNNLHITIDGYDPESFMNRLTNVAVSTGSACSVDQQQFSHVLSALGIDEKIVATHLRFGLSTVNTELDIRNALEIFSETAQLPLK